jgi:hypothetical protein
MKSPQREDFTSLGDRAQLMLLSAGLAELRKINFHFFSRLQGILPGEAVEFSPGPVSPSGPGQAGYMKSPAALAEFLSGRLPGGARKFPELKSLELLEKFVSGRLSASPSASGPVRELVLVLLEPQQVNEKDPSGARFKPVRIKIPTGGRLHVDAALVHAVYASAMAPGLGLARAARSAQGGQKQPASGPSDAIPHA